MIYVLSLLFAFNTCFAVESFLPNKFKSKITQKYFSSLRGTVRKSSGTLEYMSPGYLKLDINGKNQFTLVMNLKTSWYYIPPALEGEKGELSVGDAKQSILSKSLALLENGLTSNKLYSAKKLNDKAILKIEKKVQKEIGLKEIKLFFAKKKKKLFKNLKYMELVKLDQKTVGIDFNHIDDKVKFSSKHFEFTVPKNTNVNGKLVK